MLFMPQANSSENVDVTFPHASSFKDTEAFMIFTVSLLHPAIHAEPRPILQKMLLSLFHMHQVLKTPKHL
jgi:hypothetical protein